MVNCVSEIDDKTQQDLCDEGSACKVENKHRYLSTENKRFLETHRNRKVISQNSAFPESFNSDSNYSDNSTTINYKQ